MARAVPVSSMAATVAAGWPAAISEARLGPVRTPTRSGGIELSTSRTMPVIVDSDPCSMPFVKDRTGQSTLRCGVASVNTARNPCDGTAMTSRSASDTAFSRLSVALNRGGRSSSGK